MWALDRESATTILMVGSSGVDSCSPKGKATAKVRRRVGGGMFVVVIVIVIAALDGTV